MEILKEKHEKPSSEEDDQRDCSNKKVKSSEDDPTLETRKEENQLSEKDKDDTANDPKPTYCEIAMSIDGYQPSPKEIIHMVREELCPMLEDRRRKGLLIIVRNSIAG
ncbi:hypothetical protein RIF29_05220 [Crotalaria pallida]|uniref:Uncharacterized protein n=1 Tax=Crotalaria pallida TaxID=3830 RepID=A0AAN9J2V6_CROPI